MVKNELIFIPSFNEAEQIGTVINDIKKYTDQKTVDVLVIDDGSTDATAVVAEEQGAIVLKNPENQGNGSTTRRGFEFAISKNYKFIIKIDADGQHEASYIPKVFDVLRSNLAEFVICSRYHPLSKRANEPPDKRRIVNIMITEAINKLTDSNLTDVSSGFCGYSCDLLKKIQIKTERYGAPIEVVVRARLLGYEIFELPHPVIYKKSQNPIRIEEYVDMFATLKNELKFEKF